MLQITNTKTMSSLEVVELINIVRKEEGNNTELRHDDFMRKVADVLGALNATKFLGTQIYGNNNRRNIYNFPKREAMLMAMSYSYSTQARLYDRWQELENNQPKVPTNFIEAMTLALEQAKQLEQQAPKVAYFQKLIDRDSLLCFRDSAKLLNIPERKFINWLLDNKYIYRNRKNVLCAYSDYIPELFEAKEYINDNKTGSQTLITVKGRQLFLTKYNKVK